MEKSDNKTMKVKGGEYFTVRDMAKNLGVTLKVVNMRLFRLGIKPIARDALYTSNNFKAISNTLGKGRPPEKK